MTVPCIYGYSLAASNKTNGQSQDDKPVQEKCLEHHK